MNILIKNSILTGDIQAPASKSYEQRILAAALLSRQECQIENFGSSDDVIAARNIISVLGSNCKIENDTLLIVPVSTTNQEILFCGESALCARLFTPLACIFKNHFTLTGELSLLKRPVAADFGVLKQMGCEFDSNEDKLPVSFSRTNIKSGQYFLDGSKSSQFISGLIMALPLVPGNSVLTVKNPVSINYIWMTIQVLQTAGIEIKHYFSLHNELNIEIAGNQTYKAGKYVIEGDWSGAAFLLVIAAVCGGAGVKGLSPDSLQADKDILKVFDLSGVNYHWQNDVIFTEKSEIKAFDFDATNCPDLIPALVILAAFAEGNSNIGGIKRLSSKESPRAQVLQKELAKAGVNVLINDDTMTVIGKCEIKTAKLCSQSDHRMAMAFASLGLISNIDIIVEDTECVSKSWPDFFKAIIGAGANLSEI